MAAALQQRGAAKRDWGESPSALRFRGDVLSSAPALLHGLQLNEVKKGVMMVVESQLGRLWSIRRALCRSHLPQLPRTRVSIVHAGLPLARLREQFLGPQMPEVVVGTAGSLSALVREGLIQPEACFTVMDEEGGPRFSVTSLVATVPSENIEVCRRHPAPESEPSPKRQRLEAGEGCRAAHHVRLSAAAERAACIKQLLAVLDFTQIAFFTTSTEGVRCLERILSETGISTASLHEDLAPAELERRLQSFRHFERRALVCSDAALPDGRVAASHLDVVIGFDLPQNARSYAARFSGSRRFASQGMIVNLVVSEDEQVQLAQIEEELGIHSSPARNTSLKPTTGHQGL
eukprot:TRINITY_DN34388_c0_g1_i1.p1 TRINITY_DN34388_c0_g1~~TRINITY_DN34388_c0_g1_i1.p1  ORF type:complete len:358 (-),score=77.47 TRINITY_DN34388_c0_g1_i1:68-1111(-)